MRILFSILFFSISYSSWADSRVSNKVQVELKKRSSIEAIVYLKDQADLAHASKIKNRVARIQMVRDQLLQTSVTSQAPLVRLLKSEGVDFQPFHIENAIAIYDMTSELLNKILKIDAISFVGYNASARLVLPPNDFQGSGETSDVGDSLRLIKADKVWNELGIKGRGIVVAGQDTGYRWSHRSLKNQYRGFKDGQVDHNYNWHDGIRGPAKGNCGSNNLTPCDDTGHGTHTMGTILGSDGAKIVGVAPEAQWIGCRNMANGDGTVATYMSCFEFFLAPFPLGGNSFTQGRPELAPHVINNSWSCPTSEGCVGGEFLAAIRALNAAGIATVVAASNDGPGCGTVSSPPAIYSGDLMSVGAYNHYMKDIAFFSSRGPSTWNGGLAPNVTAPGSNVHSAVHTGDAAYDEKSGTSMASPHVAGVIALLWSAKPELIGNIERTFDIIQKTATPMMSSETCGRFPGNAIPNAVFGYGMLDAFAAVQAAKAN